MFKNTLHQKVLQYATTKMHGRNVKVSALTILAHLNRTCAELPSGVGQKYLSKKKRNNKWKLAIAIILTPDYLILGQ